MWVLHGVPNFLKDKIQRECQNQAQSKSGNSQHEPAFQSEEEFRCPCIAARDAHEHEYCTGQEGNNRIRQEPPQQVALLIAAPPGRKKAQLQPYGRYKWQQHDNGQQKPVFFPGVGQHRIAQKRIHLPEHGGQKDQQHRHSKKVAPEFQRRWHRWRAHPFKAFSSAPLKSGRTK